MTQDFSNKGAQVYTRLLTRYGQADHVKLRRVTGSTFDQPAGERTGGSSADTSVFAVAGPIKRRLVTNTRVREDEGVVIMDGAVEPLTSDSLVIGTDVFSIVDDGVTSFNIADVPVAFEVVYKK